MRIRRPCRFLWCECLALFERDIRSGNNAAPSVSDRAVDLAFTRLRCGNASAQTERDYGRSDSITHHAISPHAPHVTVGALLDGKQIDMPPIRQTSVTYKRAPKAAAKAAEQRSIFGKEDE
jgi:hypothetical protein